MTHGSHAGQGLVHELAPTKGSGVAGRSSPWTTVAMGASPVVPTRHMGG
jgi:hypothetical protein